jgi:STE24 endopeptidase
MNGVKGTRRRPVAMTLAALLIAAAWLAGAHLLWHSSVPGNLPTPHVNPTGLFSSSFLRRSSSYNRFLDVEGLLGDITLLVVLALYARRGHRLIGESAAGRIGTGMMLGMLGFAVVWLAEVPFGLVAVWWERRHHVSHQGYIASLIESFFALGGRFLFVCMALLIAMGLAGLMARRWWVAAAPVFVALTLAFTFLGVYLIPNTKPLSKPTLLADAGRLSRIEGIPGTRVDVQDVHRFTTAPNAESVGFGPTRRVILWDTLLDGRFSRKEIDVVIGHELGHLAHRHLLKRVGWLALFLIPLAALIARVTRSRGGMARPEAVPLALFVFVAAQLLTMPLWNVVSRREEAEADYSALRATRDPAAASALFVELARTSLADPNPPTWSYVLDANHPTIVQRIAMARAWQSTAGG